MKLNISKYLNESWELGLAQGEVCARYFKRILKHRSYILLKGIVEWRTHGTNYWLEMILIQYRKSSGRDRLP